MLTNRYFVAIAVPFLLILLGAISKKLIRSTAWMRDDFFLGVDLSISAISSALIFISELLGAKAAAVGCSTAACQTTLASADERLLRDAGFLVAALILFLLVLSLHQDQERNTGSPRRQLLTLGVLGNLIGVVLLSGFILLVKGV
ncbi:MAG TPA: hypothetical protein VF771_01895 [Longimicrobiaceae bacterium]